MLQPDQERLLKAALDALEGHTGIRQISDGLPARDGADAVITLQFPMGGGAQAHRATYQVAVKRLDRPAAVPAIKRAFNANDTRYSTLLITPKISSATAQACREVGLEFLDAAGNAYLRADNYLIFLMGMKAPDGQFELGHDLPAATATALKIVFTILCKPALLSAPYREIARAAGVALGAIGPVLTDLERRQFVVGGTRHQRRRLLDPKRLLDEWVTNYPIRLRNKLHPRRFTARRTDWRDHVDLREYGAWWGGEIAADRYTHYLRPATATVYQQPRREALTALVAMAQLRPDPKGDVEVLDAFWDLPADPEFPDVVPPLLVYADLLAALDSRSLEVANRLYRERIADALAKAQDPD